MFSCFGRRPKKNCQKHVEAGDRSCSSPQKSFPDTVISATTATAETPKKKSWWRRLLRLKKKTKEQTPADNVMEDTQTLFAAAEKSAIAPEESEDTACNQDTSTVSAATEVNHVSGDTESPSSAPEENVNTSEEPEEEAGVQEVSPAPDTPVLEEESADLPSPATDNSSSNTTEPEEEADVQDALPPPEIPVSPDNEDEDKTITQPEDGELIQAVSDTGTKKKKKGHCWRCCLLPCLKKSARHNKEAISSKELVCLGFPNLAQTCYMNSTLQGLLTLRHFINDVYNQETVWSSHPGCKLIRRFSDVGLSPLNGKKAHKKRVLAALKDSVAESHPEFQDHQQKDAHEFLCCLLNQIRSLTFDLQAAANSMGFSYTCPVDAHIAFQMLSIRTCRGCGLESMREEDYMDLSLDLVPGGSVNQCLQEYLRENELEYRCECGAVESAQRASFLTLPNVLILQLKRFSYNWNYELRKLHSPVVLSRELLVNPESSMTEQTPACYSLVSVISHLGSSADSGHYICDGVYRSQRPGDEKDRWLTYNDKYVSETTGASVCNRRQNTAYLLFYVKQQ